ncbi:DNA mismatch endonuclease Vsr [Paraburkholderia azotifigens]|uniref:very short patch repair endonuclease n=1 Tax=Paraburkholderia azotifigens TaxID=2057004 RepID=UPI003171B584
MTDRLSPERRSRLMQAVKGKNTAPELAVRSLLHALGYRFRLHRRDLPGTPDIVLPGRRCAIFVHGCFWHAHGCRIGQPPKSRLDYWRPKLEANKDRDLRKLTELEAAGWKVLVIWQCELRDPETLVKRLGIFLDPAANYDRQSDRNRVFSPSNTNIPTRKNREHGTTDRN